tara:strand:+ start:455 stop:1183 length:729 start_codon:yes stop_codon:yes gene_type:complete
MGDLNSRSAFARACKSLKENRSIDKVKEDKDGNSVSFQLTSKSVDEVSEKVKFDYECQLTLELETGLVSCDESPGMALHAQSLVNHARDHRGANDITRLVQRLFKEKGDLFPINPRKGGAYFVPEAHREFTSRIDTFLSALGGCLWRFPVPKGTEGGDRSVREAMAARIAAMLTELDEATESWNPSTRTSTVRRGAEEWRKIKHKSESYAEYLQDALDGIRVKVEHSKQVMLDKATEISPVE